MLATVDLLGGLVDADLDTLATARYVTIDELLQRAPQLAPWRPTVGMAPKLSDAELVTLAVLQALLGFSSQACWLRYADRHLRHLFAYLPGQSGDTKRLGRAALLLQHALRAIATDPSLWTDDVWLVDSTRWRAAAPRRPPSGRRWPAGPNMAPAPAIRAPSGAAAAAGRHPAWPGDPVRVDRGQGRRAPGAGGLVGCRAGVGRCPRGQTLLADKHSSGRRLERLLAGLGMRWLGPAGKGEPPRLGADLFKPLRQLIESVTGRLRPLTLESII